MWEAIIGVGIVSAVLVCYFLRRGDELLEEAPAIRMRNMQRMMEEQQKK